MALMMFVAPMQGDMMFSAGLMSSDMTSSQPGIGGPKKAEDFLDPKAKDLVNLDSLVTKPKSPGGNTSVLSSPLI